MRKLLTLLALTALLTADTCHVIGHPEAKVPVVIHTDGYLYIGQVKLVKTATQTYTGIAMDGAMVTAVLYPKDNLVIVTEQNGQGTMLLCGETEQ